MQKLFIITSMLLFLVGSIEAATNYTCSTKDGSSRQVFSKGTLSFTDQIIDETRVLSNVKAFIRSNWEPLSLEVSDDEYTGEFSFEKISENKKYRPRIYKNYSQFVDFNAQKSSNGMWGNLLLEKNNGTKSIQVHYIFQAGDHMGGVIDFYCNEAHTSASPVAMISPYYQSVKELSAVLKEAAKNLDNQEIVKELGTYGGIILFEQKNDQYFLNAGKCQLGFNILYKHTSMAGPVQFKVKENTVNDVTCVHY